MMEKQPVMEKQLLNEDEDVGGAEEQNSLTELTVSICPSSLPLFAAVG